MTMSGFNNLSLSYTANYCVHYSMYVVNCVLLPMINLSAHFL